MTIWEAARPPDRTDWVFQTIEVKKEPSMKLLQVVADGTPGGGTTNVLALTEDLLNEGIDVVFCSQTGSYANEQAKMLGAAVITEIDFFRSRLDRQIVSELRRAISPIAPDLTHFHGGRAAFPWVRGASRSDLARTCYTVRGYHFSHKRFPLRWLAKLAERRISHLVGATIHVSEDNFQTAVANRLVPIDAKPNVIRNGIRLSDIPVPVSPGDRRHVAFLGRLTYPKNPNLVLDIAKRLQSEGFVIHLIGGGDLEDQIHQRIKNESIRNVITHGSLPRQRALQQMSTCGTFVMPSRWEGLPIAPVEAMQMGLAVVISDVNGCTEVVTDKVHGRICASGDENGFTDALRRVVNEPEETDRMIASAKQRVAKEFTRERVVRQHLELYQQCLA